MPQPPLSESKRARIVELLAQGKKTEAIARAVGVAAGTVSKVKHAHDFAQEAAELRESAPATAPETADDIRRLLKKGPATAEDLADALDCSPRRVRERIAALKAQGHLIAELPGGLYDLALECTERNVPSIAATSDAWNHRLGIVSDNHLCNKHSRLDVLNAAYDRFEREGITTVFNAGNWIDGEHRFTRPECIVRPGMDAQIDYMLENYPQRKGITTHYIAGDDHEGWYQQRECIEIGRYLQMRAEAIGRTDLKYLGYAEADIELKSAGGSITGRIVHPGGGSAYAISYTDQKRVESYQGGEKPSFEIAGHYHKYNAGYPREVWTLQAGCTCDQTLFMRKKRLQAHVGYLIVELRQDVTDGHLAAIRHEFTPFYNRGLYEKRFA